jgi:hypothetical protein
MHNWPLPLLSIGKFVVFPLQPGLTIAEISAGYPFLVHVALATMSQLSNL